MFVSLKPKVLPQFPVLSLSLSSSCLKWVSTATTKAPHVHQNPQECITFFFDARTNHNPYHCELSLISALKSCSYLQAIPYGRQIHCLVFKSGLQSHTFIRNSLMNMYAKCSALDDACFLFDTCSMLDPISCNIMLAGYVKSGQLDNARKLFDVMPGKGCVSYTTMIMGLVQNCCWNEAIQMFKDMRSYRVNPNELTMVNIISACSHLGGICNPWILHALVIKLKLEGLVLVSTNLLHLYCLNSSVEDARKLFDEMPERNIVTWNVMLNGYTKMGHVDLARELFDGVPGKDVVSWGTIIDGYVQNDCLREALMMYHAMLLTGLGPNDVMLVDLIAACGRLMAIPEGQQFHGVCVVQGFDLYNLIQSTIINFYAACGMMNLAHLQFAVGVKDHLPSWNALIAGFIRNQMIDEGRSVFNEMPERDVFSWSTMISGYAQVEQPKKALELFYRMISSGIQPNEITMVSVFSAIANLGTLQEGRWAHKYLCHNSIPLNDNLSSALIDMYAKCGSIDTAIEVFYKIRDGASSVSPWNTIICGLGMHGHVKSCLNIFSSMQKHHIKPNSITFIGILSACCHAGLVDPGRKIFKSMKSVYDIEPNIKHYGCMVDLLGRAGQLEEAEELINSMPMKADIVIWGTLLGACRIHGNLDIGERAAKSLSGLQPSHGGGKVLLSNIYADAGRWEDVLSLRRILQSRRMERLPGRSVVINRVSIA